MPLRGADITLHDLYWYQQRAGNPMMTEALYKKYCSFCPVKTSGTQEASVYMLQLSTIFTFCTVIFKAVKKIIFLV